MSGVYTRIGLGETMTKIIKEDIAEYQRCMREAGTYGSKIEARVEYILRTVYRAYGAVIDYWYFCGSEEGQEDDLFNHIDDKEVSCYYVETQTCYEGEEMLIRLDDGDLVEFGYSFPTRWLYEDFEEEVLRGKAAYEQELADKKAEKARRRAAKKAEKERLKASAASKLTAEEKKALGLR